MPVVALAQQAPEPQYTLEPELLAHGQLTPLETCKAQAMTEDKKNFVITPTFKTFQSIPGAASPVRVAPDAHFVIKGLDNGSDLAQSFLLQTLVTSKKDREIPQVEVHAGLLPFMGTKQKRQEDRSVALHFRPYDGTSTEIIPAQPLAPGEYVFPSTGHLYCFGVDSGATPSGEAYPAVAATPAPATLPGQGASTASAFAAAWSAPLSAGPTTNQVYKACKDPAAPKQTYCYGVLTSSASSAFNADEEHEGTHMYCNEEHATAEQVRQAFYTEVEAQSGQLEGPFDTFFGIALEHAFGCPKQPVKHTTPRHK